MAVSVTQRRARDTRTTLLEAARDVFSEVGYTEANVADVVARAGSSVGSMYHHFGGKADLYLALYDEHQSRQEARAEPAVAPGPRRGGAGPAGPVHRGVPGVPPGVLGGARPGAPVPGGRRPARVRPGL